MVDNSKLTAMTFVGPDWLAKRVQLQFGDKLRELGSLIITDCDDDRDVEAEDDSVSIVVKVRLKRKTGRK